MAGPTITVSPAAADEGQDVTFIIQLSQATPDVVTVDYEALSGLAERNIDFRDYFSSPLSGKLSFAPGETTKTLTFNVRSETLDELDEAFTLRLFQPEGGQFESGITTLTATGWALDNDGLGSNQAIAVSDSHVSEDGGTARFTLSLSEAFNTDRSFSFSTYDLTAKAGSDYVARTGNVTFLAGQTEAVVEIDLINDGTAEMTQTFGLQVAAAHGLAPAHATGHIQDDDGDSPMVSVMAGSATEGQRIPYIVTLSQAAPDVVHVDYAFRNGSGDRSSDYRSYFSDDLEGRLTFAPGETTKVLWTYAVAENQDERDESVVLELNNPTGVSFGGSQHSLTATGWVLDDDGLGDNRSLGLADIVVTEGAGGKAIFTLTLSEAFDANRSFSFSTYDLTAKAGSDYIAKSGNVTFLAGQTQAAIEVDLINDNAAEKAEAFGLRLNAAYGVPAAHATARIQDDDGSMPTVSVEAGKAVEGERIPYIIRLSQAATDTVQVDYQFLDGSGARNVDFREYFSEDLEGTLTFAPGQLTKTIWTYVSPETEDERDESVLLELRNPVGLGFGENTHSLTAIGWAMDNDGLGLNRSLEIADIVVSERAGGKAIFTLELSEAFDVARSFSFATQNGSARAGSDYVAKSGNVTFQAGQTSAVIEVNLINNRTVEPGESFDLVVTGAHNVTGTAATAQILDDDASRPIISIEGGSAVEGQWIYYTIRLSEPSTDVVTVDYAALDGLAKVNSDYRSYFSPALSGTLTFAPGDTVQYLPIFISSETEGELDENMFLQLRNPKGAGFGGDMRTLTATGWALDNDGVGINRTVSVSGAELREGPGNRAAVFAVEISTPHDEAITLKYETVAGTARQGADYVGSSGNITFRPGQTRIEIPVQIKNDLLLEKSETFFLRVTPPFPAALSSVAQVATGVGTIIDGAIRGTNGPNTLIGTAAADLMDGLGGNDRVWGRAGNDVIFGGAGNDRLYGELGRDRLNGGAGNDTMMGGAGQDTLLGGGGNDRYLIDRTDRVIEGGGGGIDRIVAGFSTTLMAQVEQLQLTGRANLRGTGNDLANLLTGNAGNNILDGRNGNDRLIGNAGNDRMSGGNGNDALLGGAGRDRLVGGNGRDTLLGGSGNDTVLGGGGNDVLRGEAGTDIMYGGAGQDDFVFRSVGESRAGGGRDRILDFRRGIDDIDLRLIDANTRQRGNQEFDFERRADGNAVWVVKAGDHLIVRADVNGDARADLEIHVAGTPTLFAGDFLL